MPKLNAVLYLIDASSFVYRAFFALPPLTGPSGQPINAAYGFTTMLLKLLKTVAPQYLGAIFDAPGRTFRDDLFESYKANRPHMPDALASQIPLVHDLVSAFAIRTLCLPGVEADDVIGTIVTGVAAQGADTVIITADKDLMQLVGPHVRLWDTMRDRWFDSAAVRQRFGVGPDQVVEVIGLMGDAIDNIPGVKGIGEKTATTLIQRFETIDNLLARVDEVAALDGVRGAKKLLETLRTNSEIARLSRQLAVIRRDVPMASGLDTFRYEGLRPELLRPIFTRLGFQKLLKELTGAGPTMSVSMGRAESGDEIAAVVATAHETRCLAIACDHGPTRPLAMVVAPRAEEPTYIPMQAVLTEPFISILGSATVQKIAHDLKRDLRLLSGSVARVEPAFDVMLASYLLEASATHRLEDLAADALGVTLREFRDGTDALAMGVSLLPRLYDRLAPRLRELGMDRLFYDVEMPLVPVLARMEARGVQLNVASLAAMSAEMDIRLTGLVHEIHALGGGEFNIASPQQLREVLFDRLGLSTKGVRRGKTGLSTDVDVLTRLATHHPLPGKILEYRALAKLKSTYVDALPAALDPITGRLHTSFNQAVTATGRLSSSDPNLQNIPVRGEEGRRIRAAFVAADGHCLVAADYSQIELRLLAHLSNDASLIAAFRAGEDVHVRTAAEVFGVLPGTITRDMRRAAKVINFGIIYGMGAQALARELGISVAEGERYICSYFSRYAGVRAYVDAVRDEARSRGYAMTVLGRRRSLPDLASHDRAVVQAAERIAVNTPIQGSAADLIKLAMVRIDRRLQREGLQAGMILQVHDELVLEAAEADCEKTQAVVREEMEGAMALQVPLQVDLGVGPNWAEAH